MVKHELYEIFNFQIYFLMRIQAVDSQYKWIFGVILWRNRAFYCCYIYGI